MRRLLAAAIVRLAAVVLPARHSAWGRAMVTELAAIERPGAALSFAFGCLAAALNQAVTVGRPVHARSLGMLCAIGAVGLGLAYLVAAGAPSSHLAINAAALAIGLLAIGILHDAKRIWRAAGEGVLLLFAGIVLLTALLGISANGVTRWLAVGGVSLQPALILVPAIALGFAQRRGGAILLAVLIAALGLALQPDRAMAGALAAGTVVLALARPERNVLLALGASLAAFVATLLRADASPAMPFVDQIFYSSFGVHPLAGLAVIAGAALILVPAVVGCLRDAGHRPIHAMFGAVWLAVILAAAIGNHPTPLVGYGGSAILGYLLSLLCLPAHRGERIAAPAEVPKAPAVDQARPDLRASVTLAG